MLSAPSTTTYDTPGSPGKQQAHQSRDILVFLEMDENP